MDLAPDLRAALLHRRDFFGEVLQLVESFISGEWEPAMAAAAKAGVDAARLQPMYLESLAWASAQRQSSVAA
jgi:c-di-GMP-related signal transduction protein